MALTTTYITGDVAAGAQQITLNAYTAPSGAGFLNQTVLVQFASGETVKVSSDSLSPTLSVIRGARGTLAQAHKAYEAVVYGLSSDTAWANQPPAIVLVAPVLPVNTQEVTATGATGTTAANVTAANVGFLNVTGASGTGLNLPYPTAGMAYTIANKGTGVIKVYSVGATINGTTGTTAFSLTATGNLQANAFCATAGAWQVQGNT